MALHGKLPVKKFEKISFTLKELQDFKRSFELYLIAKELDEKAEKIKCAHLRLLLGDKLNDAIDNIPVAELKLAKIFKHMEATFIPKTNAAYAQFKFFSRNQGKEEPFNEFYMDLHLQTLAAQCDFKEQEETVMKSRIVLGVGDKELKERLLRSPDLKLHEIVNYIRASEDAKEKVEEITNPRNGCTNGNGHMDEKVDDDHVMEIQHNRNAGKSNHSYSNFNNYNKRPQ